MARMGFDDSEVTESQTYDREKLPLGEYLVKWVDFREIAGGKKGDRTQFDFEVVKGRNAAPGTQKPKMWYFTAVEDNRKRDNGKKAAILAACLGVKVGAIKNDIWEKCVREQKVKVTQDEGTKVISESAKAEDSPCFGKLLKLKVYDRVAGAKAKNPGRKYREYDFLPFDGNHAAFEDFVAGQTFDKEESDDAESADDKLAEALAEATAAKKAAEVEEDVPDLEEAPADPLTKAAQDGWKPHPKTPGAFYKGREALREAALVARYS